MIKDLPLNKVLRFEAVDDLMKRFTRDAPEVLDPLYVLHEELLIIVFILLYPLLEGGFILRVVRNELFILLLAQQGHGIVVTTGNCAGSLAPIDQRNLPKMVSFLKDADLLVQLAEVLHSDDAVSFGYEVHAVRVIFLFYDHVFGHRKDGLELLD
jgi:hypothetical protein